MTHDYKRNGTTDLFAALNIATGEMTTQCRKTHTSADVLAFFKKIDKDVPRSLDIHVVLDNLSAHKGPEVTEWLAHPRRARWHLHFTPPSSSWLNLVERWFKELTDRRLRRGTFTSVPHLIEAITTWVEHWNKDPKPFVWHATADKILEKVSRGRKTLSQVKCATQHVPPYPGSRLGPPLTANDPLSAIDLASPALTGATARRWPPTDRLHDERPSRVVAPRRA